MFGSRYSFISLLLVAALLPACSQRMQVSDAARRSGVSLESQATTQSQKAAEDKSSSTTTSSGSIFRANSPEMAAETEISDKSLKAWRLALKGDEKGSLAILDELDQKFPKMKTVAFMRGQVLEQLGKKAEAVKYYQLAATGNDFDLLTAFKVAETTRTSGDTKKAIQLFRGLTEKAPEFVPAHLGLAQSLLTEDRQSEEGKKELHNVLNVDPDSKEAKKLLAQIDKGSDAGTK